MGKITDITGQKFGRLTVVEMVKQGARKTYWRCQCDCENEKIVVKGNLTSGNTQGCGCLKKERTRERNTTHGKSHSHMHNV